MFRYLENKQLKNGGLNILRVPKPEMYVTFSTQAHIRAA